MKIRKSYYLLTLIIVLIPLVSLTPLVYCDSDDYDMGISENSIVVWRVTEADEEEIKELFDNSDDLDDSYFDYEIDDKIRFDIDGIGEDVDDEYYSVRYTYYENNENLGDKSEHIAKDPEDMAEDWEDLELDDYTLMFILTDTEDYIEEFGEKISPINKKFVYVSGSSIIINSTIPGHLFTLTMEYDDRGILDDFSLVYDGNEIFAMESRSYTRLPQSPELPNLVGVIALVILILIIVIACIVIMIKRATKGTDVVPPAPQKPPVDTKWKDAISTKESPETEEKKEPKKIEFGFCEKCGSKRESDAEFCSYCGSKF